MSRTRAAMFGLLPSHTMRPASSWLNPSLMNARRKVPDCELPSEIRPAHRSRDRIRRARVILLFVAEKRVEVARGGEPDAEHERILHGVLQLVEQRRIETALQADARGIRRAGKRRVLAGRERPVGARDFHHAGLDALGGFRHRRHQRRFRRVERRGRIRGRRAARNRSAWRCCRSGRAAARRAAR